MENENKQIKASKWALGILLILSAVVLVMFYGVGYGETEYLNSKNLTAPHYTGLLIVWMYALVAICAGAVLVLGIANGIKNMQYKTKGPKTGFVGIVFLLTLVAVVVSYFLAKTDPVLLGDQKTLVDDVATLKLTDTCLYSIYALVVVSVICTLLSMLGVFKSKK